MKTKKKSKAKAVKARVVKLHKLAEDSHLVGTEFVHHGPPETLPHLSEVVEIEPIAPVKHWYDFLKNW